jgi:hypothetical protein
MTQSYRGYPTPASYQDQGVINLSYLTPEEIVIKKKNRKFLTYFSIFIATIVIITGTTLLTYNL